MRYAKAIYEENLRFRLETDENIGKMLIIDTNTGEYQMGDESGLAVSRKMQQERGGNAPLFGIRIGYRTAETIGGILERIER